MKKTIKDVKWEGKTAVMRCDFNVPLKDGEITDDTRIRAALPSIKYLLENGARIVLMSHLGRPKGKPDHSFSLAPVAVRLSEYLGIDVKFVPSDAVVDADVKKAASELQKILVENDALEEDVKVTGYELGTGRVQPEAILIPDSNIVLLHVEIGLKYNTKM